ncbi:His Kinase A (phospho-acceptor) domain-containing protein [bacterium A37T11]|nr:His Kinase A (phospho-acceptor) domain-containing protein [bacterium A37T11]
MNTSFKIRILLLLLTLCFAGTAVTVRLTFHKEEVLLLDARHIERNLQQKEEVVKNLLADSAWFNSLRQIDENNDLAQDIINNLGDKQSIFVYVYSNNELVFWGSDQIVPKTDAGMPDGISMIQADNGWYTAFKKEGGGQSVVCLIPVRTKFPLQNNYLQDHFSPDILKSQNLEIAENTDSTVYNIRTTDGQYLFSVKLSQETTNTFYSVIELIMWMLAVITATIFVNTICVWIAQKGYILLSIQLFFCYFLIIRYIDLSSNWLAGHFYGGLFDPRNFASSFFFPSIGAFLLNVLSFTWFMCYVFAYRYDLKISDSKRGKWWGWVLFVVFGFFIYVICLQVTNIFNGLIVNSNINFDVTNILNLNFYSWLGILILCLTLLDLYFLIEVLLIGIWQFGFTKEKALFAFVIMLLVLTIFKITIHDLSVSFFLFSAIVFLRGWFNYQNRDFNLVVFISILLLFATIASIKHAAFQAQKHLQAQEVTLQRLSTSDDPNAVLLFFDLEKEVLKDPLLIDYFRFPNYDKLQILNEHFRKVYLTGYLSRFECNMSEYNAEFKSIGSGSEAKLQQYLEKVVDGSFRLSKKLDFYRITNSIASIEYFGLLPIVYHNETIGTLLITLNNRSFGRRTVSFPDVLVDGKVDNSNELENYAYAFYRDGNLVSQFGDYVYSLSDKSYPKRLDSLTQFNERNYSHLIYWPNAHTLIVLSKPITSTWTQLASLSFLFLVFLFFSIIAYGLKWIFKTLKDYDFSLRNLRWSILISQSRILYSTRIQAFVVLAVVLTLIIVGIITFFSISLQYKKQQEETTVKDVTEIAYRLENRFFNNDFLKKPIYSTKEFNIAAEANATDLNLYDKSGELIYSSQLRIYDLGLISRFMNPNALLNMQRLQRSEYFHREQIGNLNYIVAYARIKNDQNETIAFLSLPKFSNQKEIDERIGLLLNTLINIYALVIVALGLFAVFVANQITSPLTLVQRSLARTTIGRMNEPIFWKRNDEIGSLIKEYNTMIVALEHSAERIVRSERESAWREMAKQVAHEIKNPLTPLKLGVQLLERSWKEHDPKFNEKFEKFSKSFIEQIESLSRIASEFSDFAKLPDTKLDDLNLREIIEKAVEIFNNNGAVIALHAEDGDTLQLKGDHDQLLRSFINLLKNSLEAKLSRRKCEIDISIFKKEDTIIVTIKDNGKGIDPDVQARIFQPNFTTKSSGTGLGLAFVKKTIESMGGAIYYETKLNVGTTFMIHIPQQPGKITLS